MDLAGRLHARLHEKHSQQQGRFKEFCWVWNVMRAMGVCLVCVVCAVVHAYKDSIQGERNSREGTSYFSFCSSLPAPFLTLSLLLTMWTTARQNEPNATLTIEISVSWELCALVPLNGAWLTLCSTRQLIKNGVAAGRASKRKAAALSCRWLAASWLNWLKGKKICNNQHDE